MKEIFREFLNLLFPPLCLLCEGVLVKSEAFLCTHCQANLPHIQLREERIQVIYQKLSATLAIKEVLAYLLYQKAGNSQKLLHLLKYKNYPELGILLGRHFGSRLAKAGYASSIDLIIPVPLHNTKFRQRGYNQSEMFANGLSEALGVPVATGIIIRKRESSTQTKKSRLERWLNVSTIFQVVDGEKIKGKRILLTDDVITTGATLEACGEVLLEAGCGELSVGAIAIA